MAKYFFVEFGLQGCYADGGGYIGRFDTRRDLKQALESEAAMARDAGYIGLSKRGVANLAARAWREAHKPRPSYLAHCLPARPSHSGSYSWGLMVTVSNLAEWKEANQEEC